MRISDWSSDVCSSDLLQVIADSLDKHHGSLIGQLRLSGLLQAVSIFGFHLATVDLRQSSDVHERVLTELFKAAKTLFNGKPVDYRKLSEEDRIELLRHERSEEHTSELQSLMRTSYAVFCLKNKTQNSTTTNKQC